MDTKTHKHFHTIPPKDIKYEHLLMFEDEVGGQNPALVRMVQMMLAHIDLSKIIAFTEHCCIIQAGMFVTISAGNVLCLVFPGQWPLPMRHHRMAGTTFGEMVQVEVMKLLAGGDYGDEEEGKYG